MLKQSKNLILVDLFLIHSFQNVLAHDEVLRMQLNVMNYNEKIRNPLEAMKAPLKPCCL